MKQCSRCNNEHEKKGAYCSRTCANSRQWSEETNAKRSVSMLAKNTAWQALLPEKAAESVEKCKKTKLNRYLATSFDQLGSENRRRRVFEEQGFACNKCKRNMWEGFAIPLELEHRDADKKNNTRGNLEGLCPNCHALTPTWRRGANRPNNKIK